MRFLFLLACALGLTFGAHAAIPVPLEAALKRATDDQDRWAYTQTTILHDADGKTGAGMTVVRFDPSKPFEEQYTPLKIEGREPTDKDRAKYRKQGIERGKQLQAEAEKAGSPEKTAAGDDAPKLKVGDEDAGVDLENAKVVTEEGNSVTYEVPLQAKDKATKALFEKIRLLIRVTRDRAMIENVTAQLLAPMRLKLVAKISRGEFSLDFQEVDPQHPPVVSSIRADFAFSLLFVMRKSGTFEERRTDYVRVKPYFERFNVKIGPLKALPL